MRIRRGPTGRIEVVGQHASTCRCYSCRQSELARRIGVELHPEPEPQGPPPWLAPLVIGGILFWVAVFWFVF